MSLWSKPLSFPGPQPPRLYSENDGCSVTSGVPSGPEAVSYHLPPFQTKPKMERKEDWEREENSSEGQTAANLPLFLPAFFLLQEDSHFFLGCCFFTTFYFSLFKLRSHKTTTHLPRMGHLEARAVCQGLGVSGLAYCWYLSEDQARATMCSSSRNPV